MYRVIIKIQTWDSILLLNTKILRTVKKDGAIRINSTVTVFFGHKGIYTANLGRVGTQALGYKNKQTGSWALEISIPLIILRLKPITSNTYPTQ